MFAACLINLFFALNSGTKSNISVPNPLHISSQNIWVVGQPILAASKVNLKFWDQLLQEWVNSEGFGNNASLCISTFALIVSWFAWRSSADQLAREKREEMRQILVNLLELREEWIQKCRQITDEVERNRLDCVFNNKRALYLQAAQNLASQIQHVISSAEFITLAEENINTGDYVKSRLYFQKAVIASKRSSRVEQARALRFLAQSYFLQEPKQLEKGRTCFQRATDCVNSESDPYLIINQIIVYIEWANEEINNGFLDRAQVLLRVVSYGDNKNLSKLDLIAKVSPGYPLEETYRKNTIGAWQTLGGKYYDCSDPQKGSSALQEALRIIKKYDDSNDYSTNAKGWIHEIWGEKELKINPRHAHQLLLKASDYFSKLREDFPWRSWHLQKIENLLKSPVLNFLSEEVILESSQGKLEEDTSETDLLSLNEKAFSELSLPKIEENLSKNL